MNIMEAREATGNVSVDEIMEFEDGNMSEMDAVSMFSRLVKNGMAWTLQGSYGRTAMALIEGGVLDKSGEIIHPDFIK